MKKLRKCMPVIIVAALLVVSVSCEKLERASDVPEITFKSFNMFEIDTLNFTIKTGELTFKFIDGNADFGIIPAVDLKDTLNLFLVPFRKLNGVYDSIDMDTYGRKYSVLNEDNLTRSGQNKTIKGEIKLDIFYFITPPFDTIRYNFYIVDRAGNKSNIATTSDITFQ